MGRNDSGPGVWRIGDALSNRVSARGHPAVDVAQAMIVAAWNIAIFGNAVVGGVILATAGGLSWFGIALLVGAAGSALSMERRRMM